MFDFQWVGVLLHKVSPAAKNIAPLWTVTDLLVSLRAAATVILRPKGTDLLDAESFHRVESSSPLRGVVAEDYSDRDAEYERTSD